MSVLIFYIYLALALTAGCLCSRKLHSPDDFYVAGRKAGTLQVAGSLLATILGSSAILGSIDFAYARGWAGAWFMLCGAAGLLVLSFLVHRLFAFRGYHLPALLGTFYGESVKRMSAAVIALAWIGVVGAQLIGAAKITTALFGLPHGGTVAAIGLTLIAYTALGGQLSILKTDLWQLVLILLGLLCIFILLAIRTPDLHGAPPMLSDKFTPWELLVMLLTYSTTYVAGPDIYSRLFCARDESSSRRALLLSCAVLLPVAFVLAFIGVYGAKFFPDAQGSVLFAIAKSEFPAPVALVLYLAIFSAILSSADTTLFTAGTLLSQFFRTEMRSWNSIRATRWCIAALGLFAIATALLCTSILGVFMAAMAVYSGAFIVPVLWGIAGRRSSKKAVVAAIVAGGLLALAGKLLPGGYGSALVIAAFAANLLILWAGRDSGGN